MTADGRNRILCRLLCILRVEIMTHRKNPSSRGGKIKKAIRSICLIGIVLCLVLWGVRKYRNDQMLKRQDAEVQAIKDARNESPAADNSGAEKVSEAAASQVPESVPGGADSAVEFPNAEDQPVFREVAGAQAVNPDVLGTLEFGADGLLYVVQGTDNDYYLTHGWDKSTDSEGAAFLDCRSSQDPRSDNWIIHGHNMRSGAVFGTLKNFRDTDYLKAHPLITLTRLHEKEYYVPYAILDLNVDPDGDGYFKITEFNFDTDADFNAYTGYLTEHSYFNLPIDTEPGDSLLMLSTCSYGYSDGRLEICCRKLRDGETPETVSQLMQQTERSANPIVA